MTAISDEECDRHILAALPTGAGKTIPQLLVSSVSEGWSFLFETKCMALFLGRYCFIVPPLTVIIAQLASECEHYGLSYVDLSKVRTFRLYSKCWFLIKRFFMLISFEIGFIYSTGEMTCWKSWVMDLKLSWAPLKAWGT